MGMDATIDPRMQAALARLTENEKECLRRRLQQQTAKEMALDLGVSPHAVEKRLKMARTKLGLSSSLEAAQLLMAAEEYQRTGRHAGDRATQPPPADSQSRRLALVGNLGLIGIVAAAVVLAAQTFGSEAWRGGSSARLPDARTIDGFNWERIPPEDMAAFLTETFAMLDRDRSGYIEQAEVPGPIRIGIFGEARTEPDADQVAAGRSRWIAVNDPNDDRRVSLGEYCSASSKGENWRLVAPGRVAPTKAEIVAISQATFHKLDADRSGSLEGIESPYRASAEPQPLHPGNEAGNLASIGKPLGRSEELVRADFYRWADKDGDRRVSVPEFHRWTALHLTGGIPVEARASLRRWMPPEG